MQGIWRGTAGNLDLIARKGNVAPGTGGQIFQEFQQVSISNSGLLAMTAQIGPSNRVVVAVPGSLPALPASSVLGFGNSFIPEFEALPSVFEMLRVDGQNESPDMDTNGDGDVSCQEIVDAQDFLFSIEPPATPLDCEGIE